MRNRSGIYPIILAALFLIVITGCQKENSHSGTVTNGTSSSVFNPGIYYDTMNDQEGNFYRTIKIGNQTWMAENLRTTIYRNGDPITEGKDNSAKDYLNSGVYYNYNNTENVDSLTTYGLLYNWYAVSYRSNLAPAGWHIPTQAEWAILYTYLGGKNGAGGKLKEAGNLHWKINFTNDIADNSSGFTALPGSLINYQGSFGRDGNNDAIGYGNSGYWWSSAEYGTLYGVTYIA